MRLFLRMDVDTINDADIIANDLIDQYFNTSE